jgi:hypothetical protein
MKRRMEGHDYSDRGIYMITMAIEGRKPLLGTLHGDPSATEGSRIDDNPRRLLLKRQHPEYFTRLGTINAAGFQMQAIGNRFLLDNPVKLQIQCSRRLTLEEIEHQKDIMLYQAHDQGAILVSPCISPGEQQIATAALTERIPLIVLLLKGFSPFFKPQPKYLEACTEGRLLMLSPYPYQNEKIDNMRQRCIQLNNIAVTICS